MTPTPEQPGKVGCEVVDPLANIGDMKIRPKFSFLLPTRERPEQCVASIMSLITTAANSQCFEILLALDEDDRKSAPKVLDMCNLENIRCRHVFFQTRYGREALHGYVNKLATFAEGEHLWLWNDEVIMETFGWDSILESLIGESPEMVWDLNNNHHAFLCPLVPKRYIDAMGHFSLHSRPDLWAKQVFEDKLQLSGIPGGISLFHSRANSSNSLNIKYSAGNDHTYNGNIDSQANFSDVLQTIDANKVIRTCFPGKKTTLQDPQLSEGARRVAFIGLGKLGLPVAAGMAAKHHLVLGYDVNPKLDEYTKRRDIFKEVETGPDGTGSIVEFLDHENLKVTKDFSYAIEFGELIFVAVQTPHHTRYEGITRIPEDPVDFDYTYLRKALQEIAAKCERLQLRRTVIVISTVLPGTMRKIMPSSKWVTLCYNPYFIAMGTALRDFYEPEFILLGCNNDLVQEEVENFYRTITPAPVFSTTIESAELIKVSYNTMISMKIAFVNQLMEICDKIPGADVDDVTMALKMANRRLISPAYMQAGMGDGGGCHPRDNIAMSWLANDLNLKFDFPRFIMQARERQTEYLASLGETYAKESNLDIIVLGKAFKPNIRLTAGSPALLLYNILQETRAEVSIIDPIVDDCELCLTHPAVFIIATRHDIFQTIEFPRGSIVVDPHRYIPKRDGVIIHHVGGETRPQ